MFSMNYYKKNIIFIISSLALIVFLHSCAIWDPADARKVSPNADERVKKNLEEGKGFVLMGGDKKNKTTYQFASSNPMWRATLDILDFLPLSNVNYSGGIVTTDWYNEGDSADESIKITVRFLTNEIRADGIKVIVHKKTCDVNKNCIINKITSSLQNELQVAILKKAAVYEREDRIKNRNKRPDLK